MSRGIGWTVYRTGIWKIEHLTVEAPRSSQLSVLDVNPAWAWNRFEPSAVQPWTPALAAHLYRRAGFGASWPMLQRALALGPQRSVETLLTSSVTEPEDEEKWEEWREAAARSGNGATYVAWWLRGLLETPSVLREKLLLFWHQHFAIALGRTGDLAAYHRHLETLRKTAFDDLRSVLEAQMTDPGLCLGLGGAENRRAQPNLTFARRWLEVLTVGAEAATEDAVRETARALTGCFVYGGRLRWIEREHDRGVKRMFEHEGRLNRDDVCGILADHPGTAMNLARKMVRYWITETQTPSEPLLAPLATRLMQPQGMLRGIELLLRSNLFFSDHALGQKIKSPVELGVGLARAFEVLLPTEPMAKAMAFFGQQLDEPPTLEGWSGGVDWINTVTVAARRHWCLNVLDGAEGHGKGVDPWKLAQDYGCRDGSEVLRCWTTTLLPRSVASASAAKVTGQGAVYRSVADTVREVVRALVLDPRFQIN